MIVDLQLRDDQMSHMSKIYNSQLFRLAELRIYYYTRSLIPLKKENKDLLHYCVLQASQRR